MHGPRERYTLDGPEGFGDLDLIALILGTGAGGRSARAISAELLERLGGLEGLGAAPVAALAEVPGVGPVRGLRLHAALQLARRGRRSASPGPVEGPEAAWRLLRGDLEGLDHEELHALYLDRRGRPLLRRRLSSGNDAFTIVDPRQVLRPAVQVGAASFVLAHNHPSGDPSPSTEDLRVTVRMAAASRTLGIFLVDHIIVGADAFVSLAERGELPAREDGGLWISACGGPRVARAPGGA